MTGHWVDEAGGDVVGAGAGGAVDGSVVVVVGGSVVMVGGSDVVVGGGSVVVDGAVVAGGSDVVVVGSVVTGGMADAGGPGVGAAGPTSVVVSSDPVVVVIPESDVGAALDALFATGEPPPHAVNAPATAPTHANHRSVLFTA